MQLAVPASNEFVFPHKFKINGDNPILILNYIKKRSVIIEREILKKSFILMKKKIKDLRKML